jgi:hypothetical protein
MTTGFAIFDLEKIIEKRHSAPQFPKRPSRQGGGLPNSEDSLACDFISNISRKLLKLNAAIDPIVMVALILMAECRLVGQEV